MYVYMDTLHATSGGGRKGEHVHAYKEKEKMQEALLSERMQIL